MGLSRDETAAFLHYGFLPRVPSDYREKPWARVRAEEIAPAERADRADLVRKGLLAMREACADPGDGLHVLPLSAGIDSRFMLALLLEAGLRDRILAVTFGIPGTYDFEMAPSVARAAGVRHEVIDLTGLAPTRAELLATARRAPWTFVFEAYCNHAIPLRHGSEATYWSGCMGNVMAGTDLDVPVADWRTARIMFADRSRFEPWVDLRPPGFDPVSVLPERPPLEGCALTYFEQLFAFLRYPCRLDPVLLAPGFRWRTPFRAPVWVDFMLRVPRELRKDPSFYGDIASRANPSLFALPTKNVFGLAPDAPPWRVNLRRARLKLDRLVAARFPGRTRRPNPKLNYLDFDRELRARSGPSALVEEALERLVERRAIDWLDPLALLRRHREYKANLGEALALLASLELNLAREEEAQRSEAVAR